MLSARSRGVSSTFCRTRTSAGGLTVGGDEGGRSVVAGETTAGFGVSTAGAVCAAAGGGPASCSGRRHSSLAAPFFLRSNSSRAETCPASAGRAFAATATVAGSTAGGSAVETSPAGPATGPEGKKRMDQARPTRTGSTSNSHGHRTRRRLPGPAAETTPEGSFCPPDVPEGERFSRSLSIWLMRLKSYPLLPGGPGAAGTASRAGHRQYRLWRSARVRTEPCHLLDQKRPEAPYVPKY
jgi:hypothetical protein